MLLSLVILLFCAIFVYARNFPLYSRTPMRGAIFKRSSSSIDLPSEEINTIVIGGGLCGLSTAYYLSRNNHSVKLYEMQNRIGGNVRSIKGTNDLSDFLWEEGPNSFQPTPTIVNLASDLGILDEMVLANSELPRFVVSEGVDSDSPSMLKEVPLSFSSFMKTDLISTSSKVRSILGLIKYYLVHRVQNSFSDIADDSSIFLGSTSTQPVRKLSLLFKRKVTKDSRSVINDTSIAVFARKVFGKEMYDNLIDPFISGVYAGKGELLGAVSSFPKIFTHKVPQTKYISESLRPPAGSLGTFREGMSQLTEAMGDVLRMKNQLSVGERLNSLEYDTVKQEWTAVFHGKDASSRKVKAKNVVIATPAYATASILRNSKRKIEMRTSSLAPWKTSLPLVSSSFIRALTSVHYQKVAAVLLAVPSADLRKDMTTNNMNGFGHLVPSHMRSRSQHKFQTLGSIWATSLFPGRAPPGYDILVNFVGADNAYRNGKWLSDDELLSLVINDLDRIVLDTTHFAGDRSDIKVLGVRRWSKGIPQFFSGHIAKMSGVVEELKRYNDNGFIDHDMGIASKMLNCMRRNTRKLLPNIHSQSSVNHPAGKLLLSGNYISGVSISDCLSHGKLISEAIM